MNDTVTKLKQLVTEVNRLHQAFSKDYFETGRIETVRTVLTSDEIKAVVGLLDGWQEELGLKNWYFRERDGYRGLHIYFKNKNNFYFPWELQVWDVDDVAHNIRNHEKFKRNFV